jgi:cytochrome bd-type quinol oxidase subunit 2
VASGYLAYAGVLTVPIVGLIAGKYVVCPGRATGAAHAVLSAVIGVPAGLCLGTLAMIVQSLGIPPMRTERSSGTIRRVVERAAITAVYGTFIAAVGILVAFGESDASCAPDLLQTFGNGATWGTLAGLGISLPTVVRSIVLDLLEARSGNGRMEMVRTLAVGIVLATLTALVYTYSLLHGSGWPK